MPFFKKVATIKFFSRIKHEVFTLSKKLPDKPCNSFTDKTTEVAKLSAGTTVVTS